MSGVLHPQSQYYLHTDGSVIYKPHGGIDRSSTFVKKTWNANNIGKTPKDFLEWLTEIADLGAKHDRIRDLWETNKLTEYVGKKVEKEFFNQLDYNLRRKSV